MIKYRPQRGSLQDSMKEMKTFTSVDDMFDYIVNEWNTMIPIENPLINKEDLLITAPVCSDDRIEWNETRYVCVKRLGDVNYAVPQAIGYCCFDDDNNAYERVIKYHAEVAGGDPNAIVICDNTTPISEPVKLYSIRCDESFTASFFIVKATSYQDAWERFWLNIDSITVDHPDIPSFGNIDEYSALEEGHYISRIDPSRSFIITEYDIRSDDIFYVGGVDK